jgi:hypothetical protein
MNVQQKELAVIAGVITVGLMTGFAAGFLFCKSTDPTRRLVPDDADAPSSDEPVSSSPSIHIPG